MTIAEFSLNSSFNHRQVKIVIPAKFTLTRLKSDKGSRITGRAPMLIYEAKLIGKPNQYGALDEAIRTGLFVRNSRIRYWIDNKTIGKYDLSAYCKVLADNPEFPWARQLNSIARLAHGERAWAAISRFFKNCKDKKPAKKGFESRVTEPRIPRARSVNCGMWDKS